MPYCATRTSLGLAVLLLGTSLSASAAEKVAAPPAKTPAAEALDAEFLEYLSSFEGEQEDWTWFADDAGKPVKDDKQTPKPAKPAADK